MKQPCCIIFEIGRYRKKVVVFDQEFVCIGEVGSPVEEIADEDGIRTIDLLALQHWVMDTFAEWNNKEDIEIKGVNFTTFSGALVHINEQGKPITPVYSFLKRYPRETENAFMEQFGPLTALCEKVASPFQGMMNTGLQLYWLKKNKAESFKKVKYSLHLPNYFSYLFTNEVVSDYSNIGLHTFLWDFQKNTYTDWLQTENLSSIQLPLKRAATTFPFKENASIKVGVGIPYSVATLKAVQELSREPFLLVSSKTWTLNSNPYAKTTLSPLQIKYDCFYYMDANAQKVVASRVYAGNEHQRQVKHLAEYFQKPLDYHKNIALDVNIVWDLRKRFVQATPSTADVHLLYDCPFVERNLNQFKTYEEAYHQFILDLVAQEVAALKQIEGYATLRKVIVEGDFSDNELIMQLLAEALFDKHVYALRSQNLAALGAALVISEDWREPNQPLNLKLELTRYE